MIAFEWNKHFVTGLKTVDEQHKELISIVNKLGTLLIDNDLDSKNISEIINKLVEYTKYHFKNEEKLMHELSVSRQHISEHIIAHKLFIKEVQYLVSDTEHDSKEYKSLFEHLMYWLAYHILGTDQDMARQISLIKSGMSPEEAYEIDKDRESCIAEPLLIALKSLFKQISKKNIKLFELNRELEEKVKERTKELNKLNLHLEKLSFTDQLTGIKNRRYALNELARVWSNNSEKNLLCMMIDADDFKIVNDTYGHDAGDIVIKRLADTLESFFNSPLTVCRLGGDEFLAICPNTSLEDGIIMSKKLKKDITQLKIAVGNGFWKGSVSIGLSSRTAETMDFEELIKRADLNVYEAKRSGKNCIKYKF